MSCVALKTITIPASCKTIGSEAFSGCASLESVNLSDEVTTIGYSAFEYCTSLSSFKMPKKCNTVSSFMLGGCTNLSSVSLSNNVTTIGNHAFINCSSLKSIVIPASVTNIMEYAFYRCGSGFTTTIPSSVKSIGENAFSGKSYIHINCAPPNTVTSAFSNVTGALYASCSKWNSTERQKWNSNGNIWVLSHEKTKHVIVPPDYNNDGKEYDICENCGTTMNVKTIPKLVANTPTVTVSEIVDLPAIKISKPSAGKKKVTVKWKKPSKKNLKKIQGVEIHVVGPGVDKYATAGKKKTSKKIGGLMSKQKYTVQVRAYAYINGVKHVSAWKSKRVKVK